LGDGCAASGCLTNEKIAEESRKMKGKLRKVAAMAAIVLASANLFGWSAEGHQAIADIAQQILTQNGQFAPVQAILGNLTLAQISTCPDELRAFQSSGTAMSAACTQVFTTPTPPTGTSPWHFVDIPVSLTNPTTTDVANACANDCVLTEIDRWGATLADTTQPTALRLQALAFAFTSSAMSTNRCTRPRAGRTPAATPNRSALTALPPAFTTRGISTSSPTSILTRRDSPTT
jgi:hypothetical protein